MKVYYVDGQFVEEDKAVIPVDDLAVLRGYGVCDLMRTYKGKPYFLNEHIERLEASARKIGLSIPWSASQIKSVVMETLKKNPGPAEINIRVVITGGSSPDFLTPGGNPRLLVLVTEIGKLPDEWYENGIKVITQIEERAIPDAKVTAYIPAVLALKKARKGRAVEALYVNARGHVLEGTTSNLFAFFGDTLVTPENNVLKGITRKVILSLGAAHFTIKQRDIRLEELLGADEVFISGTNKCVVPVVRVDDTRIADGRPGKNTRKIMASLDDRLFGTGTGQA